MSIKKIIGIMVLVVMILTVSCNQQKAVEKPAVTTAPVTMTPTEKPIPTSEPKSTVTPEPTLKLTEPEITPTIKPTPVPTSTPKPTETPKPSPTSIPTPQPTPKPTIKPTSSPEPTPKKNPQDLIVWERIVGKELMIRDSLAHKSFIESFNINLENLNHMAVGISLDTVLKDGNISDSGVYESINGGKTWKYLPSPNTNYFPSPSMLWFDEEGRIVTFFFFSGGLFRFESNKWVFIEANMDFINGDLQSQSDKRESGFANNDPFIDTKYSDITYNPTKTNGLYIEWSDNEQKKSAKITSPNYIAISRVARGDKATVIYAVAGEDRIVGSIFKITIPDEILENPDVLLP